MTVESIFYIFSFSQSNSITLSSVYFSCYSFPHIIPRPPPTLLLPLFIRSLLIKLLYLSFILLSLLSVFLINSIIHLLFIFSGLLFSHNSQITNHSHPPLPIFLLLLLIQSFQIICSFSPLSLFLSTFSS